MLKTVHVAVGVIISTNEQQPTQYFLTKRLADAHQGGTLEGLTWVRYSSAKMVSAHFIQSIRNVMQSGYLPSPSRRNGCRADRWNEGLAESARRVLKS